MLKSIKKFDLKINLRVHNFHCLIYKKDPNEKNTIFISHLTLKWVFFD